VAQVPAGMTIKFVIFISPKFLVPNASDQGTAISKARTRPRIPPLPSPHPSSTSRGLRPWFQPWETRPRRTPPASTRTMHRRIHPGHGRIQNPPSPLGVGDPWLLVALPFTVGFTARRNNTTATTFPPNERQNPEHIARSLGAMNPGCFASAPVNQALPI
jgi:hypothetical protein